MDVEEVRNKKELLRQEIIKSIQSFTESTGIHPSEIYISIGSSRGGSGKVFYLQQVDISVDI